MIKLVIGNVKLSYSLLWLYHSTSEMLIQEEPTRCTLFLLMI